MSGDLSNETIQKEIEAKRRRLEELKQKRLQRQARNERDEPPDTQQPTSFASFSSSSSSSPSASSLAAPDDILEAVNSLITASPPPPPAVKPENSAQEQRARLEARLATLSIAPQPSVTVAGVDIIHYEVACQTNESQLVLEQEQQPKDASSTGKPARTRVVLSSHQMSSRTPHALDALDEAEWSEMKAERDRLRSHEIELMTSVKQLKDELTRLDPSRYAEAGAAASAPSVASSSSLTLSACQSDPQFADFFTRSSAMVERMLHSQSVSNYDWSIDYRADDEEADSSNEHKPQLAYKFTFSDAGRTAHRPCSSLDWSHKFPELMLASYASNSNSMEENGGDENSPFSSASSSSPGCVLLWNVHLPMRAECEFIAESGVLSAQFHPTHSKLLVGATNSGQLLLWDTRAKRTPVNRTSLAHSHTAPIFVCRMLPQINGSHSILSVSSDGHVCVWLEDNWHTPVASYTLARPTPAAASPLYAAHSELTVNCLDFPPRDQHTVLFGSDDGSLHRARLPHTAGGDPAQRAIFDSIPHAHAAPISSVSFQPSSASTSFLAPTASASVSALSSPSSSSSALFLTSSFDWTVKLWSAHSPQPLAEFERARDYVFDVAWHPTHPSLFVQGDATGQIDLWKLGATSSSSLTSASVPAASSLKMKDLARDTGQEEATLIATGFDAPSLSLNVRRAESGQPQAAASSGHGEAAASTLLATDSGPAISKVRWNTSGTHLAVGNSAGDVAMFELESSLLQRSFEDEERWWQLISQRATNKRS